MLDVCFKLVLIVTGLQRLVHSVPVGFQIVILHIYLICDFVRHFKLFSRSVGTSESTLRSVPSGRVMPQNRTKYNFFVRSMFIACSKFAPGLLCCTGEGQNMSK
jgi:hypothetical protein